MSHEFLGKLTENRCFKARIRTRRSSENTLVSLNKTDRRGEIQP